MKELWVLKYNFGQRAFHVDPIEKSMETNREIVDRIMNNPNKEKREAEVVQCAWFPIAVGTYEELDVTRDLFAKKISEKENWEQFYNPTFLQM